MPLLLTTQKADLYSLLERKKGVNPTDFAFVYAPANPPWHDETGDAVRFRRTDYHFTIYRHESERFAAGEYDITFSPGYDKLREKTECRDWAAVCAAFDRYLSYLLRETTAVDPWESAKQFSSKVQALPHPTKSNAPITGAEKDEIQKALNSIQATLSQHVGNAAQKQRYIEEQFRLLRDSITKFGRKDYLMLLYTTVIGMATTIDVPPDVGNQIVEVLNDLLSHMPQLLA